MFLYNADRTDIHDLTWLRGRLPRRESEDEEGEEERGPSGGHGVELWRETWGRSERPARTPRDVQVPLEHAALRCYTHTHTQRPLPFLALGRRARDAIAFSEYLEGVRTHALFTESSSTLGIYLTTSVALKSDRVTLQLTLASPFCT